MTYQYLRFPLFLMFLCGCLIGQSVVAGTAYKCIDENGTTIFSDAPCKGVKTEQIYIHENFTEGESLRPNELKMIKEIERRENPGAMEMNEEEISDSDNKEAYNRKHPTVDKEACKKATEDLKTWQNLMSFGYPPSEKKFYMEELTKKTEQKIKSCGN